MTAMRTCRKGSILIPTTFVLVAILGMGALAVDAAYMMEAKAELQHTADAIVLAAASGLLVSQDEARRRAQDYADRNPVLGQPVDLGDQEVRFGRWDPLGNRFDPSAVPANALRATLRLTETSVPQAPAFALAKVIGFSHANITVMAAATLGNRDVMLVLDKSGSMAFDWAVPQQPLTDTKKAAKRFLDLLKSFPIDGDQASLVWYNEVATLKNRLTNDFQAVKISIDSAFAAGCTNIPGALLLARQELGSGRANPRALPVIILLSDGVTNTTISGPPCGSGEDVGNPSEREALEQARLAARDGFTLYTISLGRITNRNLMTRMAEMTGGRHFYSPTVRQLDSIFEEISRQVPITMVE